MPFRFLGRKIRQRKAVLALKREAKSIRRLLAKRKVEGLKPEMEWTDVDSNESLRLDQRVVLRARGQVPVQAMVSFHKFVKNSAKLANRTLAWMNRNATRRGDHLGAYAAVHRAGLGAIFQE